MSHRDRSSKSTLLALLTLLLATACDERTHRVPFVGNELAAAQHCVERGYRYFRVQANGQLACYHWNMEGTYDAEAVVVESRMSAPEVRP